MPKQAKHLPKRKVTLMIAIGGILILAAGFLLKPQLSGQPVEAADAGQAAAGTQEETVESAETPDVIETAEIPDYPTAQTVNGVEIRLMGAQQADEALVVNVCYDLPDDSDWTLWNSTLERDGKTYHWTEVVPTEIRKPPANGTQELWTFKPEGGVDIESVEADPNQPGYRCETIYFRGATNASSSTPVTLTIEALEAAPREGEYCSSAYLRKVQDALDARQAGITVKCIEEEYHDGLEVVTKPESMSMESAKAYLGDPDFYLDLNGLRGPWVFTFTLD